MRGTYGNSIAESPSQSPCAGGGSIGAAKAIVAALYAEREHSLDSDAEAKIVQLILIAGLFAAAAAIAIGELIHRLGKPPKQIDDH